METLLSFGIGRKTGRKNLNANGAVKAYIACTIDLGPCRRIPKAQRFRNGQILCRNRVPFRIAYKAYKTSKRAKEDTANSL